MTSSQIRIILSEYVKRENLNYMGLKEDIENIVDLSLQDYKRTGSNLLNTINEISSLIIKPTQVKLNRLEVYDSHNRTGYYTTYSSGHNDLKSKFICDCRIYMVGWVHKYDKPQSINTSDYIVQDGNYNGWYLLTHNNQYYYF